MRKIEIETAPKALADLVEAVERGDEVVITRGDRAILRLAPVSDDTPQPDSILGWARGAVREMAVDFDLTPPGFEDYL